MRILIAFDGSECSNAALDDLQSSGLPELAHATVLSDLDAWLPAESPPGSRADEALPRLKEIRANVQAALKRQRDIAERGAARVRELFPQWSVNADACADEPAWAIIKRAEGQHGGVHGQPADLVVLGSHGYGGVRRLVLGSVSHRVLTQLGCSVRVARGRAPGSARSGPRPPKIVVGVDGSADAQAALNAVAGRQWPTGTTIVVAVFEKGIGSGRGSDMIWGADPWQVEADVQLHQWAVTLSTESAEFLRQRCPGASVSSVARAGDPKYGFLAEAEAMGDGGADCIFVGARGVRAITRFFLGSVSTAVAMNAHCSVEIVHPQTVPAA